MMTVESINSPLTHDELGVIAAKHLKKMGYHIALSNLWAASIGEKPDALGIDISGESFLIEAKVSRSDFLADKKKPWRKNKNAGTGTFRGFIAPHGLIKPDEIPYGWAFWEVDEKRKITVVKGLEFYMSTNPYFGGKSRLKRIVGMDEQEYKHFRDTDKMAAMHWLIHICRRIQASGVDIQDFAASNELWGNK